MRWVVLAALVCALVLAAYNLGTLHGKSLIADSSAAAHLVPPSQTVAASTPPASTSGKPAALPPPRQPQPYVKGEPPPYIPTLAPEGSADGLADPPTPGPDDVQVHFINVGQGDAILILAPGGQVALIDGGYRGMGTVEYLQAHGVERIALMVATHPHADHIGGLVDVLHEIPVDEVVTNGYLYTTQVYEQFLDGIAASKARYREVHKGDTLKMGALTFQVLNPESGRDYGDINDTSIVLRMAYGSTSFLFTGDAEAQAERSMVASGQVLQATILKVGHHGSRTSTTSEFVRAVQPQVAIYSAGVDNPYGHPHTSPMENLAREGAVVYGTDLNSTVVVTANQTGYTVTTQKGSGLPARPWTNRITSTATPARTYATATTTVKARQPATPTMRVTEVPYSSTKVVPTPDGYSATNLLLEVVSLTSPARRNSLATLVIRTAPGAYCTIDVIYKSGSSVAGGLEPIIADSKGKASWTWQVGGNTTKGTWKIIVTSSIGGIIECKEIPFEVK
ncbi:MAG TPA: MBL fold metallo-hydrolase [Chloroflexia bacterium]